MKNLNIPFEEWEYTQLLKIKNKFGLTWKKLFKKIINDYKIRSMN